MLVWLSVRRSSWSLSLSRGSWRDRTVLSDDTAVAISWFLKGFTAITKRELYARSLFQQRRRARTAMAHPLRCLLSSRRSLYTEQACSAGVTPGNSDRL